VQDRDGDDGRPANLSPATENDFVGERKLEAMDAAKIAEEIATDQPKPVAAGAAN
jgi:hypothetical protein